MRLDLHPEGNVYIRADGDDYSPLYSASLVNFQLDYGSPVDLLAGVPGAVALQYGQAKGAVRFFDRKGNQIAALKPWPLGEEILGKFAELKIYRDAREAPPPPTAQEIAEAQRRRSIDQNLSAATLGAAQPATLQQLKAMSLTEYNTWFDANFDTPAKLIGLVKQVVLVLVRKVL